jgi:hypothetical protein
MILSSRYISYIHQLQVLVIPRALLHSACAVQIALSYDARVHDQTASRDRLSNRPTVICRGIREGIAILESSFQGE